MPTEDPDCQDGIPSVHKGPRPMAGFQKRQVLHPSDVLGPHFARKGQTVGDCRMSDVIKAQHVDCSIRSVRAALNGRRETGYGLPRRSLVGAHRLPAAIFSSAASLREEAESLSARVHRLVAGAAAKVSASCRDVTLFCAITFQFHEC